MFKKRIIFSLIGIVIGFFVVSSSAIIIEKSSVNSIINTTLYVGGSGPGNYSDIQSAINDANNGDTVFVYNGIYEADIYVNKTINLIGEDRENTIIEMGDNGISIYADGVKIKGFNIQKCGGFWHRCGIYIGSNHNFISHNIISNNEVLNGIFLENSYNCSIFENIISFNKYFGIRVEYSSNNKIFRNYVSNVNADGIVITESNSNEVYENTVKENSWSGINCADFSFNNKIYHNNLFNNIFDNGFDELDNIWDDDYPSGGNFWDDYTGVDNDDDGIGDTPYPISGGNIEDRYPLMIPYGTPHAPTISGPSGGKPGKQYDYTFSAVDPDDDNIFYFIKWGDGNVEEWIGPYDSGEEISLSHIWNKQGTYTVMARVKDTFGLESEWKTLELNMQKNRQINVILMNFLRCRFYIF
jgi:parallel beta-helix repeat protein